jgi:hypothetical protein
MVTPSECELVHLQRYVHMLECSLFPGENFGQYYTYPVLNKLKLLHVDVFVSNLKPDFPSSADRSGILLESMQI